MVKINPKDIVACICEGQTEKTIITLLLEQGLLCFKQNQLLNDELFGNEFYRNSPLFEKEFLGLNYNDAKLHLVSFKTENQIIGFQIFTKRNLNRKFL